jgi:hypothetical protein
MKWYQNLLTKIKPTMAKKEETTANDFAAEHNELSLESQTCKDETRKEEIKKRQQELHGLMNRNRFPEGSRQALAAEHNELSVEYTQVGISEDRKQAIKKRQQELHELMTD